MTSALPTTLAGVVFDLDGTLVDSSPDLARAVNTVLLANGGQAVSVQEVCDWVGRGAKHMLEAALASQGIVVEHDVYPAFRAAYLSTLTRDTLPYPGIVRLLAGLRKQGVAVAVCTNKPEAPALRLVQDLGMAVLLDALVGGDTLAVKKPDPAPIHLALERIGIAPEAAVMVGDSVADIEGGKAAGMPTIGVTWGYGDCGGGTVTVSSVEELTTRLLGDRA